MLSRLRDNFKRRLRRAFRRGGRKQDGSIWPPTGPLNHERRDDRVTESIKTDPGRQRITDEVALHAKRHDEHRLSQAPLPQSPCPENSPRQHGSHTIVTPTHAEIVQDAEPSEDTALERSQTGQRIPSPDSDFDRVQVQTGIYFDHTADTRPAVTHEDVRPHVHTVYETRRTRSFHIHEHRTVVRPIIDPDPTVLPEEHWAHDAKTGETFKIPDSLGRWLDEACVWEDDGYVTSEEGITNDMGQSVLDSPGVQIREVVRLSTRGTEEDAKGAMSAA